MKRPAQLDKLRQLFERRANAALLEVRQGQMRVSQLEIKRNEIRECVNAHQQKLTHLDNSRPSALQLSVEHLRAEAGARDIVERDLRKEVFYLQAAEDDIVSANRDLLSTRTQWQVHRKRLDALARLEHGQQLSERALEDAKSAAESDELGIQNSDGHD